MFLLVHLSIGPLMLVIFLIFKRYPPKKINHTYGYRTKRSMKNQDTWDVANKYSLDWMIKMSALLTISQIVFYFLLPEDYAILLSVGLLLLALVASFWATENHLKEMFDEEGKR